MGRIPISPLPPSRPMPERGLSYAGKSDDEIGSALIRATAWWMRPIARGGLARGLAEGIRLSHGHVWTPSMSTKKKLPMTRSPRKFCLPRSRPRLSYRGPSQFPQLYARSMPRVTPFPRGP